MGQPTAEQIVAKLGEPTRTIVENAIQWLEKEEPKWYRTEPVDRWEFIAGILERANFEVGCKQCM